MKIATATLKSVSPYSQSLMHEAPKLEREGHAEYEERTWREKMHYDRKTGEVFIPPTAFKESLASSAKFTKRKIAGKGNSTYTKHFVAGVLVTEALPLGVRKEDVPGEWLLMNADGVKGSGKRVKRCFPRFDEWSGDVQFLVLDETITQGVFTDTLVDAGRFIGIGRFRPEKGGYYGRVTVEAVNWSDA